MQWSSASVFLIGAALAGAYTGSHVGQVSALYEAVYPSDPAQQHALDMCFLRDTSFDRADSAERDACYQEELGSVPNRPPSTRVAGFVDRWRAAEEGPLPADDIRAREADDRFLHLSDSGPPPGATAFRSDEVIVLSAPHRRKSRGRR